MIQILEMGESNESEVVTSEAFMQMNNGKKL